MPSRFAWATPSMLEVPLSTVMMTRRGRALAGRTAPMRDVDDRGRQPVAVAHAVGHHEADVGGSQHPQPAHRDGAARRSVRIVVPDHHDGRARLDSVVEHGHRAIEIEEPVWRQQAGQRVIEVAVGFDRPGRERPAHHGMDAGEIPGAEFRYHAAPDAFHRRC